MIDDEHMRVGPFVLTRPSDGSVPPSPRHVGRLATVASPLYWRGIRDELSYGPHSEGFIRLDLSAEMPLLSCRLCPTANR